MWPSVSVALAGLFGDRGVRRGTRVCAWGCWGKDPMWLWFSGDIFRAFPLQSLEVYSIAKRRIVIKPKAIFQASGVAFYGWFLTSRRAVTKRALQGNAAANARAAAELWKSWGLYPNSAARFLMKPQLHSSHIVQKADCVSLSPSAIWNGMIPWHLIGSFLKAEEHFIKAFGWLSFQKKSIFRVVKLSYHKIETTLVLEVTTEYLWNVLKRIQRALQNWVMG